MLDLWHKSAKYVRPVPEVDSICSGYQKQLARAWTKFKNRNEKEKWESKNGGFSIEFLLMLLFHCFSAVTSCVYGCQNWRLLLKSRFREASSSLDAPFQIWTPEYQIWDLRVMGNFWNTWVLASCDVAEIEHVLLAVNSRVPAWFSTRLLLRS